MKTPGLIIITNYSLLLRVLRALRGSKLFAFLTPKRTKCPFECFLRKRTQFAKRPNEHNLFINKALWKYTMFTDPRKRTQYEPKRTQFKANLEPNEPKRTQF